MIRTCGSTRLGRCGTALFLLASASLATAGLGAAYGQGSRGQAGVEAVTKASEDVTLSFNQPGKVAKVLVKEGQIVKPGDLLVQQDDSAEQVQLQQLKAQADSNVQVRAAEAKLDQARVDYQKMKEAGEVKAAAPLEVEHAKLDMTIAELSLELARFTHEQDRLKYEEFDARVERMRIRSPIAGAVEKILVQAGESKDPQQPIIRVVSIDPLWIDVPVPLRQSVGLAVGGEAKVDYPLDATSATGKIIHVSAVADATSDTLLVRVEASNPRFRKAGEHVRVSFAQGGKAQAASSPAPAAAAPRKDAQAVSAIQPKESP
jgi:RND family efflux transporter MFP subunit